MSTRINIYVVVILTLLLAGGAHAGMKLKIEKSTISVSSSTTAGNVVVWGPPGSVYGAHPISFMVHNKVRKVWKGGVVKSDGSFSVMLPGYGNDGLKIKFTDVDGKKKSVSLKVPEAPVALPPMVETKTVIEQVEVIEPSAIPPATSGEPVIAEEVEVTETSVPPPVVDDETAVTEVGEFPGTQAPGAAGDRRKELERKYPEIKFHWMKEAPSGQ